MHNDKSWGRTNEADRQRSHAADREDLLFNGTFVGRLAARKLAKLEAVSEQTTVRARNVPERLLKRDTGMEPFRQQKLRHGPSSRRDSLEKLPALVNARVAKFEKLAVEKVSKEVNMPKPCIRTCVDDSPDALECSSQPYPRIMNGGAVLNQCRREDKDLEPLELDATSAGHKNLAVYLSEQPPLAPIRMTRIKRKSITARGVIAEPYKPEKTNAASMGNMVAERHTSKRLNSSSAADRISDITQSMPRNQVPMSGRQSANMQSQEHATGSKDRITVMVQGSSLDNSANKSVQVLQQKSDSLKPLGAVFSVHNVAHGVTQDVNLKVTSPNDNSNQLTSILSCNEDSSLRTSPNFVSKQVSKVHGTDSVERTSILAQFSAFTDDRVNSETLADVPEFIQDTTEDFHRSSTKDALQKKSYLGVSANDQYTASTDLSTRGDDKLANSATKSAENGRTRDAASAVPDIKVQYEPASRSTNLSNIDVELVTDTECMFEAAMKTAASVSTDSLPKVDDERAQVSFLPSKTIANSSSYVGNQLYIKSESATLVNSTTKSEDNFSGSQKKLAKYEVEGGTNMLSTRVIDNPDEDKGISHLCKKFTGDVTKVCLDEVAMVQCSNSTLHQASPLGDQSHISTSMIDICSTDLHPQHILEHCSKLESSQDMPESFEVKADPSYDIRFESSRSLDKSTLLSSELDRDTMIGCEMEISPLWISERYTKQLGIGGYEIPTSFYVMPGDVEETTPSRCSEEDVKTWENANLQHSIFDHLKIAYDSKPEYTATQSNVDSASEDIKLLSVRNSLKGSEESGTNADLSGTFSCGSTASSGLENFEDEYASVDLLSTPAEPLRSIIGSDSAKNLFRLSEMSGSPPFEIKRLAYEGSIQQAMLLSTAESHPEFSQLQVAVADTYNMGREDMIVFRTEEKLKWDGEQSASSSSERKYFDCIQANTKASTLAGVEADHPHIRPATELDTSNEAIVLKSATSESSNEFFDCLETTQEHMVAISYEVKSISPMSSTSEKGVSPVSHEGAQRITLNPITAHSCHSPCAIVGSFRGVSTMRRFSGETHNVFGIDRPLLTPDTPPSPSQAVQSIMSQQSDCESPTASTESFASDKSSQSNFPAKNTEEISALRSSNTILEPARRLNSPTDAQQATFSATTAFPKSPISIIADPSIPLRAYDDSLGSSLLSRSDAMLITPSTSEESLLSRSGTARSLSSSKIPAHTLFDVNTLPKSQEIHTKSINPNSPVEPQHSKCSSPIAIMESFPSKEMFRSSVSESQGTLCSSSPSSNLDKAFQVGPPDTLHPSEAYPHTPTKSNKSGDTMQYPPKSPDGNHPIRYDNDSTLPLWPESPVESDQYECLSPIAIMESFRSGSMFLSSASIFETKSPLRSSSSSSNSDKAFQVGSPDTLHSSEAYPHTPTKSNKSGDTMQYPPKSPDGNHPIRYDNDSTLPLWPESPVESDQYECLSPIAIMESFRSSISILGSKSLIRSFLSSSNLFSAPHVASSDTPQESAALTLSSYTSNSASSAKVKTPNSSQESVCPSPYQLSRSSISPGVCSQKIPNSPLLSSKVSRSTSKSPQNILSPHTKLQANNLDPSGTSLDSPSLPPSPKILSKPTKLKIIKESSQTACLSPTFMKNARETQTLQRSSAIMHSNISHSPSSSLCTPTSSRHSSPVTPQRRACRTPVKPSSPAHAHPLKKHPSTSKLTRAHTHAPNISDDDIMMENESTRSQDTGAIRISMKSHNFPGTLEITSSQPFSHTKHREAAGQRSDNDRTRINAPAKSQVRHNVEMKQQDSMETVSSQVKNGVFTLKKFIQNKLEESDGRRSRRNTEKSSITSPCDSVQSDNEHKDYSAGCNVYTPYGLGTVVAFNLNSNPFVIIRLQCGTLPMMLYARKVDQFRVIPAKKGDWVSTPAGQGRVLDYLPAQRAYVVELSLSFAELTNGKIKERIIPEKQLIQQVVKKKSPSSTYANAVQSSSPSIAPLEPLKKTSVRPPLQSDASRASAMNFTDRNFVTAFKWAFNTSADISAKQYILKRNNVGQHVHTAHGDGTITDINHVTKEVSVKIEDKNQVRVMAAEEIKCNLKALVGMHVQTSKFGAGVIVAIRPEDAIYTVRIGKNDSSKMLDDDVYVHESDLSKVQSTNKTFKMQKSRLKFW